MDGLGREFQRLQRVDANTWQADGWRAYNSRGAVVVHYQPYTRSSGACAMEAPADVLATTVRYDASHRELSRTLPDSTEHGTASQPRTEYAPLRHAVYDSLDADAGSPFAETPTISYLNGLGAVVAVERPLSATEAAPRSRALFDGLGRPTAFIGVDGTVREQEVDLLGRVLRVDDPSAGVSTMSYEIGRAHV